MPIQGLLQVTCTRSDGATVTATINYNPTTSALTSAQVVNGSTDAVEMIAVNGSGTERRANVQPGTRNFSAAQMAAIGLNTLADVQAFSVSCV